jgi:anti-sigma factor RsiW
MGSSLSCEEFVEFLDDYLSGRLSREVLARFNAHLAGCPSCVAYTKTYQQAVRLGQSAWLCPDETVPPEAPEDLVRAILAAREGKR